MDYSDEWLAQVGATAQALAGQIALGGGPLTAPDPERFAAEVTQRLAEGRREYGDSWRSRPLSELRNELAQEPPDVAAWALLSGLRMGLEAHERQLHLIRAAALAELAQGEIRAAFAGIEN